MNINGIILNGTEYIISDGGVPTEVRQSIYTLLDAALYKEEGLTDEKEIIKTWARFVISLVIDATEITISGIGQRTLTATTIPADSPVLWASNDENVATVSNTGVVTSVGNGTCIITAMSGDQIATCAVTVTNVAISIQNNLVNATNSNNATTLNYGDSYLATITPFENNVLTNVVVTMRGIDVTDDYYSDGIINIPSVIGNLAINVTASTNFFIYDKSTAIDCFVDVNTNKIAAGLGGWNYLTYCKITPGKTYKVSKLLTSQFRVATLPNIPADGEDITNTVANHSGTEITISAGSTDNYMAIVYYYNNTGGTYEEKDNLTVRASIVVEVVQ